MSCRRRRSPSPVRPPVGHGSARSTASTAGRGLCRRDRTRCRRRAARPACSPSPTTPPLGGELAQPPRRRSPPAMVDLRQPTGICRPRPELVGGRSGRSASRVGGDLHVPALEQPSTEHQRPVGAVLAGLKALRRRVGSSATRTRARSGRPASMRVRSRSVPVAELRLGPDAVAPRPAFEPGGASSQQCHQPGHRVGAPPRCPVDGVVVEAVEHAFCRRRRAVQVDGGRVQPMEFLRSWWAGFWGRDRQDVDSDPSRRGG